MMKTDKAYNHTVNGTFETADDLLWSALSGEILNFGTINVKRSGRIGHLVEMVMAKQEYPNAYKDISFESTFSDLLEKAIRLNQISGMNAKAQCGVFPATLYNPNSDAAAEWIVWSKHAELAAIDAGFPHTFALGVIGAIMELHDNIYLHSRKPETGLIAFAARKGSFEFVVADAGVGVLTALRENPDYKDLSDAGSALKVAIQDGNSRFARATGHGYGIGNLFRALAGYNGQLRFRSDDHTLVLTGDSLNLSGQTVITQKAKLSGLTISVLCSMGR